MTPMTAIVRLLSRQMPDERKRDLVPVARRMLRRSSVLEIYRHELKLIDIRLRFLTSKERQVDWDQERAEIRDHVAIRRYLKRRTKEEIANTRRHCQI